MIAECFTLTNGANPVLYRVLKHIDADRASKPYSSNPYLAMMTYRYIAIEGSHKIIYCK